MTDPAHTSSSDVRIAGFDTSHEAELARAYLTGLGIPCRIEGDMIPRQVIFYATSLWDIRLFVPENRAQEAHELLEEYRKATAETPRDESVDSRVFRAFRASVLGVPLLPVGLHLFSAWLLRGIRYRDLDARSRRRYSAAQVINWSVFVLLAAIVIRWLR